MKLRKYTTNELRHMAEVLSIYGVPPDATLKGYRANHPFVVAVTLAEAQFKVMPCDIRKIPMLKNWPNRASCRPRFLARQQHYKQPAGWAVRTGDGLAIIDIDGEKGEADLKLLEARFGPLPHTWTTVSGRPSGGRHLWFDLSEAEKDLRNQTHIQGCSIDIRGAKGQAVLPGSLHKSGSRYRWAEGCAPDEVDLAQLPEAWMEFLPKAKLESEKQARPALLVSKADRRPQRIVRRRNGVMGDGPWGDGFHGPINREAIALLRALGMEADLTLIKAAIREKVLAAPKSSARSSTEIDRYLSDEYLDAAIASARKFLEKN